MSNRNHTHKRDKVQQKQQRRQEAENQTRTPTTFYTCDMCQREVFDSKAALDRHVAARHSSVVPDSGDLDRLVGQLEPVYHEILEKQPEKWRTWGEMTFRTSEKRDAGPKRLAEACDARQQLEKVVQRWRPTARVFIFGSSVAMGLWDGLSDIDFSIIDVDALEHGEWPPNEKNAVRGVANYLRRIGFTHPYLEAIEHARVPIIKHTAPTDFAKILNEKYEALLSRSVRFLFDSMLEDEEMKEIEHNLNELLGEGRKPDRLWWDVVANRQILGVTAPTTTDAVSLLLSPPTSRGSETRNPKTPAAALPLHEELRPEIYRIDFDLSFRAFGVRNSMLLRHYLNGHVCARPGALVLKDWSKTSGVNDSMHGYLTSYAVNILWIYFLVQRGLVEFKDPQSIPKNVRNVDPEPTYVPLVPADAQSSPEKATALFTQMGKLLLEFYAFYVFEFDWANHVVSLNRPGITTKEMLYWDRGNETTLSSGGGRGKNTRYTLCIEDPYEDNLNLGRHIGPVRSQKFHDEFRRALLALVKGDFMDSCVFPKKAAAELLKKKQQEQEQQEQQRQENNNNTINIKPAEGNSGNQSISDMTKLLEVTLEVFDSVEAKNNSLQKASSSSENTSSTAAGLSIQVEEFVTTAQLRDAFNEKCPSEFERVRNSLNWTQLTRALGLKCVGDVVKPFKSVSAMRRRQPQQQKQQQQGQNPNDENNNSTQKASSTDQVKRGTNPVDFASLDLSDRVLATFVNELTLENGVELLPSWMKMKSSSSKTQQQQEFGEGKVDSTVGSAATTTGTAMKKMMTMTKNDFCFPPPHQQQQQPQLPMMRIPPRGFSSSISSKSAMMKKMIASAIPKRPPIV